MSRRGGALAALALAAAVTAAFLPALSPSRVFFQRDILGYWYPGMAAFRRAIAEGALPLWNPWSGFGAPLLADASFQIAYPPTWLALLLPLAVQYKLFVLGHSLWAGLGAYRLGRGLRLSPPAALAGGIGFALSGPLLSAASLSHHYAGASWMPWVLSALLALLRAPGLGTSCALAVAGGAQLLAGSGDACLVTGLLGLGGIGFDLVAGRRPAPGWKRALAAGALAAVLAGCLGAPQWLPTAAQAARGTRPAQGAQNAYWSLHPLLLVDLAVPRLLSDAPLTAPARTALFEGRSPLLGTLYLGVVTLGLASLALVRPRRAGLLAGLGAVFLCVASLGRHTPLWGALSLVPGFALMRYPQKLLLGAGLCLALVAAEGAQRWLEPWDGRTCRACHRLSGVLVLAAGLLCAAVLWLAAGGPGLPALAPAVDQVDAGGVLRILRSAALLALFGLALAWRASRARAAVAATALTFGIGVVDLAVVSRGANPLAPAALAEHRPALADQLQPYASLTRVYSAPSPPDCARVTHGPAGWDKDASGALAAVESMRPPSGARWGVEGSFDGSFTGLEPLDQMRLVALAARLSGTPQGTRLLQTANVGHVLQLGPAAEGLRTRDVFYACPLEVLQVPDPLPRAYVVGVERPAPVADPETALLDPGFDARQEVLIAGGEKRTWARAPGDGARVVTRRADQVVVEAVLAGGGVLVLAEAYDPGWRATVDGAAAPVLQANVLFRGVRLGPGRHRVAFDYRPRSAVVGAWAGLAGASLCSALAVASALRARAARGSLNRAAADASIRPPGRGATA